MFVHICSLIVFSLTSKINVTKAFACQCKSRDISHVSRVSHGNFRQPDHYWAVLKKSIIMLGLDKSTVSYTVQWLWHVWSKHILSNLASTFWLFRVSSSCRTVSGKFSSSSMHHMIFRKVVRTFPLHWLESTTLTFMVHSSLCTAIWCYYPEGWYYPQDT